MHLLERGADAHGMSDCGALASGALKLLFWHVLQPALYFWVFSDAFPALEPVQRVLGCLVAVREAVYLLSLVACACVNPAFLLVDVGASVRDDRGLGKRGRYTFLFAYVIAPEKFVATALFREGGLDSNGLMSVAMLVGVLLDLCGVAALGAGVGAGNLPPALAVGYSVTLWLVGFYLVGGIQDGDKAKAMLGLCATVCCLLPAFLVPLALCLPAA